MKRPVAYQEIDGARHEISADFKIANARITIALGDYDHSRSLTIDPVLLFSTYFGGTVTQIQGTAIDTSGNVYIAGWAYDECPSGCAPFPATSGSTYSGAGDAFISELSADGSTILYATLIGGTKFDEASSVAVDGDGNAYITGQTFSTDFPATVGTTTAPGGDGDGFVAKFDTSGAATWATYIGGSGEDDSVSIALKQGCSSNCNAYVAGRTRSSNFTGASGLVGTQDAFVTELKPDGTNPVVYTKLLGGDAGQSGAGSGIAFGSGIAVDSAGDAFVAGGTDSSGFPKTTGSLTASTDAFAAKLIAGGTISYARLFGGSDFDRATGVALQPNCGAPCNAYVHGITFSKDFPTTVGALQRSLSSEAAEFVTELSGDGTSSVFSTYLGTTDFLTFASANGIAVNNSGDVFVIGLTTSQNFPLHNQIQTAPGPHGALLAFGPTGNGTPDQPTWPSTNGSPLAIQTFGGSSSTVFVGSTTGLYVSSDGLTFSKASATSLPAGPVTALQFDKDTTPNPTLFAGTPSGLYISSDMGSTFSASGLIGKHITAVNDIDNGSGPLTSRDVIAGTVGDGEWSSIDGGANFSQVSTGIPTTATVTSTTASKSGASTTVLAGTSRGVYVSTDVLTSFPGHWIATKLTSPAIASMNTDSNSTPPVDYAGSYFEGIFETTDGFNTFIAPNLNLSGATVGAIDHGNSTTPSTIWAGVTSLQQAYVNQNTTGYNGAFDQTTLINQPGSIRALKNQQAGELLEFHPVVAELNSTGTQLTFSTYLASSSWDTPGGIAVDPTGSNIYVAGTTYGSDFPIAGPTPLGTGYDGFSNGFVSQIGPPPGATATATGTPGGTPTSTATPTRTPTATPSATSTPTGARISAPSTLTVKPVGIGIIGASSTAKFVIKNIGKSGDLIGNISLENNQGNGFKLSSSGSFDIAHGKSLPYMLTFIPDATLDTATITITSNDPTKGPIVIHLTGTGLPGQLSVPKTLTITSKGIGIEGQAPLVLKNVGKGLLNGTSPGPMPSSIFGKTGGGGGGGNGIAPGKTKTLTITFTPTQTGTTPGSIEIDVTPPSTPASATVTLIGIVKGKK